MSVVDRTSLEASPLADLHAIASELSLDGYRRLRRADLITAIIDKQGGVDADGSDSRHPAEADSAEVDAAEAGSAEAGSTEAGSTEAGSTEAGSAEVDAPEVDSAPEPKKTPRRRAPRSAGRTRPDAEAASAPPVEETTAAAPDAAPVAETDQPDAADPEDDEERAAPRRRRGRRGGRGRSAARDEDEAQADTSSSDKLTVSKAAGDDEVESESDADLDEEETVEGVVELLGNGSGFVRVEPPDPSDEDVYISSAQVKRCELVSGDRIAGPKRAPRRSERFASLIRIETINGRPASELSDGVRFDDLPAAYPDQRIKIGSEDPTLKAIEWLTPFGQGSRVAIVGPARSGKTEAMQRLAAALADRDDLVLTVVLAGVRPEEISAWGRSATAPVAAVNFAASEEARSGAIEPVIDQARRLAARGTHAVVLIDTLDGASAQTARKALASARNIAGGGSLTVIATATAPIGGETTVIALDVALASVGRFPALDIISSGTVRPELLVGEAGAEAIARTRAEASESDSDD